MTHRHHNTRFCFTCDFKIFAEGVIMAGGGKQPMKLAIIDQMNKPTSSKEFILTKAQNFILAGMGLGV